MQIFSIISQRKFKKNYGEDNFLGLLKREQNIDVKKGLRLELIKKKGSFSIVI